MKPRRPKPSSEVPKRQADPAPTVASPAKTAPAPLPLMRSFEDAESLFRERKDPFYLAAFMFQFWLSGLVRRAAAEYAEKKNPKERALQSGESWAAFLELFPSSGQSACGLKFAWLFRFCAADASPANPLRQALVPLSIEHDCTGKFFGPKTDSIQDPAARDELQRKTIIRWCDWLDAAIHLRTHRLWHASPGCFAADPDTRYLASLGNAQRHLGHFDLRAQVAWFMDFYDAAQHFKDSPKWAEVGKAMAGPSADGKGRVNSSGRAWNYADVDTLVIALWPLVKYYNWTYRDLLTVTRSALRKPDSEFHYPTECEQEFATYCVNVLGLRKTGKGASAKSGRPAGYEVAIRLCPGLEQKETKTTK